MAQSIKLNPMEGIFGLPPKTHVSDNMIVNSMPILEITPGRPNFESGMTLFQIDDDWATYKKILSAHGFELSSEPIKFAFIADNFPTDSFTNEYGETFLQKFTDVASQGMQQLVQMSGADTFTDALKSYGTSLHQLGEGEDVGALEQIAGGVGSAALATQRSIQNLMAKLPQEGILSGVGETLDAMMGGHRVDFPMIWRNSGFTPSYTVTLRFYNPNPGSDISTKQHIVGPLAVLLCLAIPRSKNGKTFNWPFFHKIKAPGIYNLDPAVITNMTVVKGGDQQQISFKQNMGMVDVRLDFTSLYGTMVLEEERNIIGSPRPTVKGYLDSLTPTDKTFKKVSTRNQLRQDGQRLSGSTDGGRPVLILSNRNVDPSVAPRLIANNRNAVSRRLPQAGSEMTERARVSNDLTLRQRELALLSPPGLLIPIG